MYRSDHWPFRQVERRMEDWEWCDICEVSFNTEKAAKQHLKSEKHMKNTGQAIQRDAICEGCGKSYSREADCLRHKRLQQCQGPSTLVPLKRSYSDEDVNSVLSGYHFSKIRHIVGIASNTPFIRSNTDSMDDSRLSETSSALPNPCPVYDNSLPSGSEAPGVSIQVNAHSNSDIASMFSGSAFPKNEPVDGVRSHSSSTKSFQDETLVPDRCNELGDLNAPTSQSGQSDSPANISEEIGIKKQHDADASSLNPSQSSDAQSPSRRSPDKEITTNDDVSMLSIDWTIYDMSISQQTEKMAEWLDDWLAGYKYNAVRMFGISRGVRSHTSLRQSGASGRSRSVSRPLECPTCHFVPSSDEDMLRHISGHLDGMQRKFVCPECDFGFLSKSHLLVHTSAIKKGHCGFGFKHDYPCAGCHHRSDPHSTLTGTERTRFELYYLLAHCLQLDDVADLEAEVWTINIARRPSRASNWSLTTSRITSESDPVPLVGSKVADLRRRMARMSLRKPKDVDKPVNKLADKDVNKRGDESDDRSIENPDNERTLSPGVLQGKYAEMLRLAIVASDVDFVRSLLEVGADSDAFLQRFRVRADMYPLGFIDSLLINAMSPLAIAVLKDSEHLVGLLCNHGFDANERMPNGDALVDSAFSFGHSGAGRALVRNGALKDDEQWERIFMLALSKKDQMDIGTVGLLVECRPSDDLYSFKILADGIRDMICEARIDVLKALLPLNLNTLPDEPTRYQPSNLIRLAASRAGRGLRHLDVLELLITSGKWQTEGDMSAAADLICEEGSSWRKHVRENRSLYAPADLARALHKFHQVLQLLSRYHRHSSLWWSFLEQQPSR